MNDKLIADRLETIADVLDTGQWTKEDVVEELRFIASEMRVADEIRHKSIATSKHNIK